MALDAQILLLQGERLAGGDPQLPLDQIKPRYRFGHRVLDLQPRVHLHEVEAQVTVACRLGDELDGSGTHIFDGLGRCYRRLSHLTPAFLAHSGGGCLLKNLLVAALHGAVALKQMNDIAVGIAEHLDLDMAGPVDVAFDEHRIVAEAVDRLAPA